MVQLKTMLYNSQHSDEIKGLLNAFIRSALYCKNLDRLTYNKTLTSKTNVPVRSCQGSSHFTKVAYLSSETLQSCLAATLLMSNQN